MCNSNNNQKLSNLLQAICAESAAEPGLGIASLQWIIELLIVISIMHRSYKAEPFNDEGTRVDGLKYGPRQASPAVREDLWLLGASRRPWGPRHDTFYSPTSPCQRRGWGREGRGSAPAQMPGEWQRWALGDVSLQAEKQKERTH